MCGGEWNVREDRLDRVREGMGMFGCEGIYRDRDRDGGNTAFLCCV